MLSLGAAVVFFYFSNLLVPQSLNLPPEGLLVRAYLPDVMSWHFNIFGKGFQRDWGQIALQRQTERDGLTRLTIYYFFVI